MDKYNLKISMTLYCKNGETVILESFNDTDIFVWYKGALHKRPISAVNSTLFLENPQNKNKPASQNKGYAYLLKENDSSDYCVRATFNNPPASKSPGYTNIATKGNSKPQNKNKPASQNKGYAYLLKENDSSDYLLSPSKATVINQGVDFSYSPSKKSESTGSPQIRSCEECYYYNSGECSEWTPCDQFRAVYKLYTSETDYWSKEGDATRFKKRNRKK